MLDREKVIHGLEACVSRTRLMQCKSCPYQTDKTRCVTTLMQDALTLLKEQEPVRHGRWIPINRSNLSWSQMGIAQYKCSECRTEEGCARKDCPECGANMDNEEEDHETESSK